VTRPTGNAWYAKEVREMRQRSLPRRGLRKAEAATYIGVAVATFDQLVSDGAMPPPKAIPGGESVWDIDALDMFFSALPDARAKRESRLPRM
jgi:predicted DNA-binding transcriptional regulator AlpA